MDKITDPFEFELIIETMREHAENLPSSQVLIIGLLNALISDALHLLDDPKFEMPRLAGDMDDADGINHLLTDYPPTLEPGHAFHNAFLRTEEEAAARFLLKLYLAMDSVKMGFGLQEDDILGIERMGAALLTWRLRGDKYDLETILKNNAEFIQRGKAALQRLDDMHEAAKEANTVYTDKEAWRKFDRDKVAEASRNMNKSDRISAVIKAFKLSKKADRTVRRALFNK